MQSACMDGIKRLVQNARYRYAGPGRMECQKREREVSVTMKTVLKELNVNCILRSRRYGEG